jgi:hypothetical protein
MLAQDAEGIGNSSFYGTLLGSALTILRIQNFFGKAEGLRTEIQNRYSKIWSRNDSYYSVTLNCRVDILLQQQQSLTCNVGVTASQRWVFGRTEPDFKPVEFRLVLRQLARRLPSIAEHRLSFADNQEMKS